MSIHEQLKAAGVELAHHESDLYARVCPAADAVLAGYQFRGNVKPFTADDGTGRWYDIPFAYDPAWK